MIAALYLSRKTKSSNHFQHNGVQFGWEALENMLKREVTRISRNQLPRVPGLKESFIYRDPWTRLNVKPAKIIQVNGLYIVYHCSSMNVYDFPSALFNSKSMYYQNCKSVLHRFRLPLVLSL